MSITENPGHKVTFVSDPARGAGCVLTGERFCACYPVSDPARGAGCVFEVPDFLVSRITFPTPRGARVVSSYTRSGARRWSVSDPARGAGCVFRLKENIIIIRVSDPARGAGCVQRLMRLAASGLRFPTPRGARVVSRYLRTVSLHILWFPTPRGARVVSRPQRCTKQDKTFPTPRGARVVSTAARNAARSRTVSDPARGAGCVGKHIHSWRAFFIQTDQTHFDNTTRLPENQVVSARILPAPSRLLVRTSAISPVRCMFAQHRENSFSALNFPLSAPMLW